MISMTTQSVATRMPVAPPAASSSASRYRLAPTFTALAGEVCLQHGFTATGIAATGLAGQCPEQGQVPAFQRDGDAVSGLHASGLRTSGLRTSGLPGYPTVPTTTVRNEKHDSGSPVRRPPI